MGLSGRTLVLPSTFKLPSPDYSRIITTSPALEKTFITYRTRGAHRAATKPQRWRGVDLTLVPLRIAVRVTRRQQRVASTGALAFTALNLTPVISRTFLRSPLSPPVQAHRCVPAQGLSGEGGWAWTDVANVYHTGAALCALRA